MTETSIDQLNDLHRVECIKRARTFVEQWRRFDDCELQIMAGGETLEAASAAAVLKLRRLLREAAAS